MYIAKEQIIELEEKYGTPKVIEGEFNISWEDFNLIMDSAIRKNGRAHDFTVFTFNNNKELLMIRKHFYQKGAYRPPSGGVAPGEDLETGILREMKEETGINVTLTRYLLRINALFFNGENKVGWTTHVLQASGEGKPNPIDTFEIDEAKWGTLEELNGPIREKFLKTNRALLTYRVFIHDEVTKILKQEEV